MSESLRPQVGVIHSKIRYLGTALFSAALVLILSKSLKWDRSTTGYLLLLVTISFF